MIYPPNQKPPIWSIDPGVIAYNCQKAGMPHPLLAMPMWEGAGNRARDYSGHRNHGTNHGADWIVDGLGFNGTSDYVDCGSSIDPSNATEYTLMAFIKSTSGATLDNIVGWWDGTNGIFISSSTSGEGFLALVGGSYSYGNVSYDTHSDGVRVAMVYDGSKTGNDERLKLYVNGEQKSISFYGGAVPSSIPSLSSANLKIGDTGSLSRYWDGSISDVYIYNHGLIASQTKFHSDNPYFMYQIPEELYGYVAGAPPVGAIMNQFQKHNVGADLYNGAIIA